MSLFVDLEASIEESCAELLDPWQALVDDEALEFGDFEDAFLTLADHDVKLRALRITDDVTAISAERLRELLALPSLADIEVVMLPTCKLGKEGGKVLGDVVLPKLRLLDVRRTAIGDIGARALASSKLALRLEHLSIAGAFLSADGFQALLDSPLGSRRRSLHIEEEDQPESVIPTLMQRLYELGSGDNAKVARAFQRLLEHPALTQESRDELRYQWDLVMSN